VAGDPGRLLDVGRGAGGHLVAAEHLLLGHPAAHRHRDVGLELLAADRDPVALGQADDHAERAAAGMMVALWIGSEAGENQAITAWPASW
jgi:hypothetical protein